MQLLQARLEVEKDLLARRRKEGRTDMTALILLKRTEQEITLLERRINAKETAKNEPACFSACGIVHYVKKAMHRLRDYYHRSYNTVLRIFKRNTLQAKGGLK